MTPDQGIAELKEQLRETRELLAEHQDRHRRMMYLLTGAIITLAEEVQTPKAQELANAMKVAQSAVAPSSQAV